MVSLPCETTCLKQPHIQNNKIFPKPGISEKKLFVSNHDHVLQDSFMIPHFFLINTLKEPARNMDIWSRCLLYILPDSEYREDLLELALS